MYATLFLPNFPDNWLIRVDTVVTYVLAKHIKTWLLSASEDYLFCGV